jgi:predicted dehydrogenase
MYSGDGTFGKISLLPAPFAPVSARYPTERPVTFRIGLIGSGNISDTHARAALAVDGVALEAHWGRNRESTARMAERYGGRAYHTLDELLAHQPLDAVLVGTPSGVHAEHAAAAARRGLHVLVEKPLEVTVAGVDELLDICAGSGVTLGVFFQDRTSPDLIWLKNQIASGALGAPVLASASVRWYRPPEYYATSSWRGTKTLDGGGALMNQGIHSVDLLLWLLGDVTRTSAFARTALHDIDVEDTVVASMEFASGAIGTLEVTTAAYPGLPRRIAITGTEGTIVVEGDRVTEVALRTPPEPPAPMRSGSANASASSPVVSDMQGHRRVIEDFVSAVRDGRTPRCSGAEGRRSVALVEAIYRSASSGSVVTLQ